LANGILTVAATRAFVTFDAHDLDFVTGPMTLAFVWGQTTPADSNSLTFHNGGYTPKAVSLWGEAIEIFNKSTLESDYDVTFLGMNNAPVGPGTTYTCQGFNLTQKNGQSTQAIVFEPVVNPIVDQPYVHHMVLYTCTSPVAAAPFSCLSMPTQCTGILYAWGKGGGPLVLPTVTGVQIGTTGRTYVALQMHYNNVANVVGMIDDSGINIYRTNMIRATQSGMFLMGTQALLLPAHIPAYTVSATCPATYTAALPAAGVTAYASFLHAHQRGRRIWTDVIRGGVRINTIGDNQNYDFNLQKVQLLSPTVAMLPGDAYNTYCTYDMSQDNSSVTFGETTSNEMCFNFVAYYPLLPGGPTTGCNVDADASTTPAVTSCSLLPGDPPPAYQVSGWTTADKLFLTGGTVNCSTGFKGTAVLGCTGYGAPYTFSGCVRVASPTPKPQQLSAAVHFTVTFAVLCSLALLW